MEERFVWEGLDLCDGLWVRDGLEVKRGEFFEEGW
jgi:hypothetical protein